MKHKSVFLLLGLAMAAGITLTIVTAVHQKDIANTVVKTPVVSEQTNKPSPPTNNEATPTGDVTQTPTPSTIPAKPKDPEKKDILPGTANAAESDVRIAFREFKFMDGIEQLQSVVKGIKNEGDGKKLYQLLQDGTYMANLLAASQPYKDSDQAQMVDMEGINALLGGVRDPENILLAALSLHYTVRENVLVDQASLNPIFKGTVRVVATNPGDEQLLNQIKSVYPKAVSLQRIDFVIEEEHLYANVVKFEDESLKVFSIKADGETHYETIEHRRAFYEKFNSKKGGTP